MKIIYLDFDGVIHIPKGINKQGLDFSQSCIENLQWLIKKNDMHVCIISSWAKIYSDDELWCILIGAGLQVRQDRRLPKLVTSGDRGDAIKEYIEQNNIPKKDIIILEDDAPKTLRDRCIKCHNFDGLTMGRVTDADKLLNEGFLDRDALGTLL